MTKCVAYWNKLRDFIKRDDFEGFANWCKTDKRHLREEWRMIELLDSVQICTSDIVKLPADALRPLIRKENAALVSQALKKIESHVKGGHVLTRRKVEEFMFGKPLPRNGKPTKPSEPPMERPLPPQSSFREPLGLRECEYCHMGVPNPVKVDGKYYCSVEHAKEDRPPPPRVEEKTWEPKVPKQSWKEAMHPKVSKMEEWLREVLSQKGISFLTDQEFCAIKTYPDIYFPEANLAVYLDGEKVHRDRVHKDDFLRKRCTENTGIKIVGLTYRDNTQKSRDEILQKVLDEMNGK